METPNSPTTDDASALGRPANASYAATEAAETFRSELRDLLEKWDATVMLCKRGPYNVPRDQYLAADVMIGDATDSDVPFAQFWLDQTLRAEDAV